MHDPMPEDEDMFDDLVNRHLHSALQAWSGDDIPEMLAQSRRVVHLCEMWEHGRRDASTQEGEE